MIQFEKKPKRKKKKIHGKSIMQAKKDGTCYLCKRINEDWTRKEPVHEHHVFGGVANRPISEQYGLKVYLCLDHHTNGPDAVHTNKKIMDYLRREGQKAFERNYPELNFVEIFGKNYL